MHADAHPDPVPTAERVIHSSPEFAVAPDIILHHALVANGSHPSGFEAEFAPFEEEISAGGARNRRGSCITNMTLGISIWLHELHEQHQREQLKDTGTADPFLWASRVLAERYRISARLSRRTSRHLPSHSSRTPRLHPAVASSFSLRWVAARLLRFYHRLCVRRLRLCFRDVPRSRLPHRTKAPLASAGPRRVIAVPGCAAKIVPQSCGCCGWKCPVPLRCAPPGEDFPGSHGTDSNETSALVAGKRDAGIMRTVCKHPHRRTNSRRQEIRYWTA